MEHTSESNLEHPRPMQQCKATILQFKVKIFKLKFFLKMLNF